MTNDPEKKDPPRTPGKRGNIRLGEMSGSDATNALHETIKKFTEQSARQTTTLIGLTWAIVGLTVVMLLLLVVQIWHA